MLNIKNDLFQAFFQRFRSFKINRISETVSLGEKTLSLAKNPFILTGTLEFTLSFLRRKILVLGEQVKPGFTTTSRNQSILGP